MIRGAPLLRRQTERAEVVWVGKEKFLGDLDMAFLYLELALTKS